MVKLKADKALVQAKTHERKGEVDQARDVYRSILEVFPKNARARQALARITPSRNEPSPTIDPPKDHVDALMARYNAGDLPPVIEKATTLLKQHPRSITVWTILGGAYRKLGQLPKAEGAFRKVTDITPSAHEAFVNLAQILIRQRKFDDAIAAYQRVITLKPDHVSAYNNMGLALFEQGQLDEALSAFAKAVALKPDYPEAYNNSGLALYAQGDLDAAIVAHDKAITLKSDYAEAYYGKANALKKQDKLNDAVVIYKRALEIQPNYAKVLNNMGNALGALEHHDEALKAYQRLIKLKPNDAAAHNNMGNIFKNQGLILPATAAYERAIEIDPEYALAHGNIGVLLTEKDDIAGAIIAYERAIKSQPDLAAAHYNIGLAYKSQGHLDLAIASFQRTLDIDPSEAPAQVLLYGCKQQCCDWSSFDEMEAACDHLGITTEAVSPFTMLAMEDNPERQMMRSQNWARTKFKQPSLPLPAKPAAKPKRLRIGYFSADFYNHPCLYLLLGMLLDHDKSRFELFVYSFSKKKSGELRKRAIKAVDHFIDIADMPDAEVIDLARSHEIDVAVDLTAYTTNSRSELLQYRLAPVQINYLGFPSTMGTSFIDYIVADQTVIPDHQRQNYDENVIYLPHTYLQNDNTLEIADSTKTRADFGLPEDGFVFCSFNNSYKIGPREFDIWMRLLSKIEGSVLWLLSPNEWSGPNLQAEAKSRGIDPSRIVFAPKVTHPEHMARHKHADIFMDTFFYNAHTTASESLWAGLPLVTKTGEQFAARVATSLLKSVGLPELITTTDQEYEELILNLAQNPEKLNKIKEKLRNNRLTQPLFNTRQNTRAFEDGLQQAYDLYFEGQVPQDIRLKPSA